MKRLIAVAAVLTMLCAQASGQRRSARSHRESADAILARMMAHYDSARTYQGMIETHIISAGYVGKTVIRAAAETNGRGGLARSRIEMVSSDKSGSTKMTRVDDGRTLWTYSAASGGYRREPRRPDRLSSLFRPFLESARKFAPHLRVKQAKLGGRPVYKLSGKGKGMGSLNLYADRSNCALVKADAVGPTGGIMLLSTSDEKWDQPIPGAAFQFVPPPGSIRLPEARPGGIYGKPPRRP